MNRRVKLWTATLAAAAWLLCVTSSVTAAQEPAPQSQESPAAESTPQAPAPLTPAQLDQLTAPIAVYSDPLLGMILTAATYPLEIVEATRWLDSDDHASLRGAALDEALAQQNWATS
ncbi:secreted protein, partial [mine drainage metagenome]